MPTSTANSALVGRARTAIDRADLTNDESISAVDEVRFTTAGAEAARQVLVAGADGDRLWAAVWVYTSSGSDPAPLMPLLVNADATVRTIAAAALVALGERAGFAVLQASLTDEGQLRGSHPPRSIREFAVVTLLRHVAPGGGAPSPDETEDLSAAARPWSDWLIEHAAELQFNEATATWHLP